MLLHHRGTHRCMPRLLLLFCQCTTARLWCLVWWCSVDRSGGLCMQRRVGVLVWLRSIPFDTEKGWVGGGVCLPPPSHYMERHAYRPSQLLLITHFHPTPISTPILFHPRVTSKLLESRNTIQALKVLAREEGVSLRVHTPARRIGIIMGVFGVGYGWGGRVFTFVINL